MEILSYVASLLGTFFGVCAPFGRKMGTALVLIFLSNATIGTSYLLVGGSGGAAIAIVAGVQLIINYLFQAKRKRIPSYLVAVHILAFLVINLFTYRVWYDSLAFIAAVLFVVCVVQDNVKRYRLIYFSNAVVWIVYDCLAGAYGNLISHMVLMISTILSIIVAERKL